MDVIDYKSKTLLSDLQKELKPGSKVSIAAACFSIYAYEALKKELDQIDELRFIFTSPTFTPEQTPKDKREFYIPRLNRERSLYEQDFEVKLRNELSQRAVAKECAEWIRKKATFKSNSSNDTILSFMTVDDLAYNPILDFTRIGLGCEQGGCEAFATTKIDAPFSKTFLDMFEALWNSKARLQDVTDGLVESIEAAYKENSPEFIYFVTLYNIFHEFLNNVSEDELPKEATGFQQSKIWNSLYNFQRDASLAIINKLERFNGCILADSVGLGKTYTALSVIKYYQDRNMRVLVLCPKKLEQNWNVFKHNYANNTLAEDRLNYDVLYHSDLSRKSGYSGDIDLARIKWENYELVVIDESHNFRNGAELSGKDKRENRYLRLLNTVIRKGVKTRVLMLSATPVNTRFQDLKNQLSLAYEGEVEKIDNKLKLTRSIDDVFKTAQHEFNKWNDLPVEARTTANLLRALPFDFFEVLDAVTIARSRKHVQKYYDTSEIGPFPTRLTPISIETPMTELKGAPTYQELFDQLSALTMAVYTPSSFIHESKRNKYDENLANEKTKNLSAANREIGLARLMTINLLKRLESSIYSFSATLKRILDTIDAAIRKVEAYQSNPNVVAEVVDSSGLVSEFDEDDQESSDEFEVGRAVKISIADMDDVSWLEALQADRDVLAKIYAFASKVEPKDDLKLQKLLEQISTKIENPINSGNRKILVFSAFADTADYLYDHVSKYVKSKYGLETAEITGAGKGQTTIPKLAKDVNTLLTYFSPLSKNRADLDPNARQDIDVLIATDCISEGQNLQDCDYLVNYDVHWNPVRIIQRFGRIDRIGSKNAKVQLVNFWPNVSLDKYIELRQRVETRMKIVNISATGHDNVLESEKVELEYRKAQLKKLKGEVLDLEDMNTGVSIVDLGLNEFRLDLIEFTKKNGDLDKTPLGLHALAKAQESAPQGVIYVLKNKSEELEKDRQNRLHPFYMVYVDKSGGVVCDYLSPKDVLDKMRALCKGQTKPLPELYRPFNRETRDGRAMGTYSELLGKAIKSIVQTKDQSDAESLFTPGGTTALTTKIGGLDDFELITFLVVR